MNFLEGTIEAGGNGPIFTTGALHLPIASYANSSAIPPGRKATLGLRPEHLAANGAGSWDGFRTDLVETHGADNLVWCSRDRVSLQVRLPGDHMPKLGTVLALAPDTERISLFDSDTGDRL